MKTQIVMKLAVSALALTITMVGCKPAAMAFHPAAGAQVVADKKADAAFQRARTLAGAGKLAEAAGAAEDAVALSPRDVGYRMLLADLYLKSGRFQSAETTYGDVLRLDPENRRAGLTVALAEVALGRTPQAVASLDRIADTADPADLGLAYALAGKTERAIGLLEAAARAPGASGRVRQNLALAYALAGDWAKARTTAAQDVSPAELPARLEKWAALAAPTAGAARVAALFGAQPASDPGQPVRLALAGPAPAEQLAAADPASEPAPAAAAALAPEGKPPVEAAAVPAEAPAVAGAPGPAASKEEARTVYADAVPSAIAAPAAPTLKLASTPRFESGRQPAAPRAAAHPGAGKFAVQLGAFSSPAAVERAWAQAYRRYGFSGNTPLSTKVNVPGRGTFHRLSVAGFASRGAAEKICASVRAHGGACFVRAVAGDAPVRWASRYSTGRRG